MPQDLDQRTPGELVKELLSLRAEIVDHSRLIDVAEARTAEIRACLNPLFADGPDRFFHGDYSQDVIVIRGYKHHFTVQGISLEWLHTPEFPDRPESEVAPPIAAKALTCREPRD